MAYSIKGNAIINDSRALLGVSTAGINTALYVGDVKIDAATNEIITTGAQPVVFVGDGRRLSGVVTISDGAGGPVFDGSLEITDDLIVGGGLDVSGVTTLSNTGISTLTLEKLQFTGGTPAEFASGITTDLTQSAGASELVTAEGAKTYVDAQLGGGSLLEVEGDNGIQGVIDLANDEVFNLSGVVNQIESEIAGVGFNTVTFKLADDLRLPGSLAFGVGQAVSSVGVETSLVDGVSGVSTNTSLPTQLAVKTYVDAQIAETGGSVSFTGDTGSSSFDISDEVFNIIGTTNQVVTTGAGVTVTIALTDSVDINSALDADGGLRVSGITTLAYAGAATPADKILEVLLGAAHIGGDLLVGGQLDLTTLPGTQSIKLNTVDSTQVITNVGVKTDLDELGTGASNGVLPTELAVKTYIDNVQVQVEASANLNLDGDTGTGLVGLATQSLGVFGTSLEVETVGSGTSITIGLPDAVTIQDSLTVSTGDITLTDGSLEFFGLAPEITGVTSITAAGRITANDFNSTSDISRKENIVEIDSAVEKVESLRGVLFDWKDGSGTSGGVIAQEVQEVLPSLVNMSGEDLTVQYNGLTGLLLQAVKELSARVQELEGKA